MSYDAQKVTYQEVTIIDRPALFTECRIDRATVPEGVYRYELRHGDEDWGEPIELSRSLMVNYYGTVLTREPFQLPIDGWIPMENDSLSFQDGGCRTLAEFQQKYPASDKDVIDFYSVNEPALHALYFSRSEEQDKSAGCVGHLRGDFGSGKQFYTTWWPHQQDALNTPEFKADIDRIPTRRRSIRNLSRAALVSTAAVAVPDTSTRKHQKGWTTNGTTIPRNTIPSI